MNEHFRESNDFSKTVVELLNFGQRFKFLDACLVLYRGKVVFYLLVLYLLCILTDIYFKGRNKIIDLSF